MRHVGEFPPGAHPTLIAGCAAARLLRWQVVFPGDARGWRVSQKYFLTDRNVSGLRCTTEKRKPAFFFAMLAG